MHDFENPPVTLEQAKRILPRLLKDLQSRASENRTDALHGLIQLGCLHKSIAGTAKMACRSAATDCDQYVRERAADGLGLLGNRTDRRCLQVLLNDESDFVRCSAAQSYHIVGPKLSIPRLTKIIYECDNENLTRWAVFGLLELDRPDLTDPIMDCVLASDDVSDCAKEAILVERLEDRGERILPEYLKLLQSESWLAGDIVMWYFFNNPNSIKEFSASSRDAIVEALNQRISHVESFGWSGESVEGRQVRIRETIQKIEAVAH